MAIGYVARLDSDTQQLYNIILFSNVQIILDSFAITASDLFGNELNVFRFENIVNW